MTTSFPVRPRAESAKVRRTSAGCLVIRALLLCVGGAAEVMAAVPTLDHLYPVALQRGTTTTVTAVGKFNPWPAKVWTDAPGISFQAGTKAGQLSVEVGPDVPVGPHLVRVYNEQGASAPRFLMVTDEPQGTEVEPNDEFAKAQVLDRLPTTINGRLDKSGDLDSYAVTLEAGQTLIASVEAYVLGSPLDAVLRLVDSHGLEMALNHDDGRTLDPFLTWTAPATGTYVLQVFGFAYPATADVRFTGSDACVYRLHVSRGPYVRYTIPLGIERGKGSRLRVFGWNLGSLSGREIEVDGAAFPAGSDQASWRRPEFENTLTLPVADGPEWREQEFKARAAEQPALAPPFAITGCIEQSGEVDRYGFAAKKGEKFLLEIQSGALGFSLDAWLAIQDGAGKELARNDDGAGADPVLAWTAPADGTFIAAVGNVLRRSEADQFYRLSLRRPQPGFKAVTTSSGFTVEPGKTVEVKFTAKRSHGFKSKLTAAVTGLPDGLTAAPLEVGETEKEIVLRLTASAEAQPFSGPVVIDFAEASSDVVHRAVHELVSSTSNNGVPRGFNDLVIKSTDQLWLTVLAAPSPKAGDVK